MCRRILYLYLFLFTGFHLSAQGFLDYNDYGDLSNTKASQGVAVADYDNDGHLDVYFTAYEIFDENDPTTWSRLYRNDGRGKFIDVTVAANLQNQVTNQEKHNGLMGITSGASWGDFNGDGFVDLWLGNDGVDFLYKNLGDGTFEDVTASAGVAGCVECYSSSGVWWDLDNDGDLDLYVTDFRTNNRYYENNGDETFTEKAQELGLDDPFWSWAAMPIDYDHDGDWDIYVSNDGQDNSFFRNDGGVFVNVAPQLGMDDPGNGMGIGLADYNNDLLYDLYVTNIHANRPNPFYVAQPPSGVEGQGGYSFQERAEALGVENTEWGWDIAFFDADHDLDTDMAVATFGERDFNYFFSNRLDNGRDEFTDISPQSGVYKQGGAFGIASFDFDSDGDLDLLFSNRNNEPYLLRNTIISGNGSGGRNWVQLYLEGVDSNINGYGAEVTITIGGKRYKQLYHGVGVGRQSLQPMHFGLAEFDEIELLEITWPSGTIDTYQNVDANLLYTFVEGTDFQVRELTPTISDQTFTFDLSHSIARTWNEELLHAIRNDFARPTVHARNLYHTSVAMYDAFAAFNPNLDAYLLGKEKKEIFCEYDQSVSWTSDEDEIRKAISYAAYRVIANRFANSPGAVEVLARTKALMVELGYDPDFTSEDYTSNDSRALGNYIGACVINYGNQDGANQANDYSNLFYEPKNEPLVMNGAGNPNMTNPNNWQPLTLDVFIDQSGNIVSDDTPDFLSPEWGNVWPFSLDDSDKVTKSKDGHDYHVYVDPGAPPMLDTELADEYKWGFTMVAIWQSHLGDDGVMWDISPGAKGNYSIDNYPKEYADFQQFYDTFDGGDPGEGHDVNPHTGAPYEQNIVPREDYARVLAEFWADGPDSETPPGHWFTILNYVSDNELLEKRLGGEGRELSDLEWDIVTYFTLGGTMHDAAVAAWSVKGYYDYIRPVSAIRYMADKGQSSDSNEMSYHEHGIPLHDGYVEVVKAGDPLAGPNNEHVGKIKLYTWKGPDYINDPEVDAAGVDWILAEHWWPYQRPSFVTPPFAGYVSGHSTFSRAAAEVMTRLTGDPYFPGGMGVFTAKKNEFLVFEEGPTVDVNLQWATYRDASDQTSLSRIWGGIHPPADDIPGRLMGEYIGNKAYEHALSYFENVVTSAEPAIETSPLELVVYPNPLQKGTELNLRFLGDGFIAETEAQVYDLNGRIILDQKLTNVSGGTEKQLQLPGLRPGIYMVEVMLDEKKVFKRIIIQ